MPYYCVACSVTAQQSGDLQAQQLENIRKLIFSYNAKPQPPFQSTKKNAVILSPFYPTRTTLHTTSKPSGG